LFFNGERCGIRWVAVRFFQRENPDGADSEIMDVVSQASTVSVYRLYGKTLCRLP
jgi:hypothetical protein